MRTVASDRTLPSGEAETEVDPAIHILFHIANSHDLNNSIKIFDDISRKEVKFDIIGQSYSPD